jgi:hypothetical protein
MKKDKFGNARFSSIYILLEFAPDETISLVNYTLNTMKHKIKLFREKYNNPYARLNLSGFESMVIAKYKNVHFLHSFSPE